MPLKRFNFKPAARLFLLLCVCIGGLFAFVMKEYWNTVQYKDMPLQLPGVSVLYIICIFSYLTQGISFGIMTNHSQKAVYETAVLLFWGQFILGILWPGIFFGLKFFGLALVDLFAAFILMIFTFSLFRKIDLIAAYLLVPLGAFLIFIAMLNAWFYIF